MRIEGQRESDNVEDVRGARFGRGAGLGCGGVLIALVIAALTGQDPARILQLVGLVQEVTQQNAPPPESAGPPADNLGKFASVVLASTEDEWTKILSQSGRTYRPPKLVLFTQSVPSACGMSSAATGPFYCPADQKVYIDLSFFDELARRFRAPGDFAQAYVIAHEVGHHVQNLLGIADQVTNAQRGARSQEEANRYSVALELQADCFAGVWANHANKDQNLLEPGDVEEGLRAAAAIGDDRLQSQTQGYVQPESFTHGSSEQRVQWLRKGLESGDPKACRT
jgi:predicted metalloprotease